MTFAYSDIESIFACYQNDPGEETMTNLIQACQGLVFHYAKLYGGGYNIDDLSQSGYEGLLKAIQSYDPIHETKFITYASHTIIGEIRHFVRKESRYYYPKFINNYKDKLDNIIQENLEGRDEPITISELADALNLQEDSILPLMSAGLVHLGHPEIAAIKAQDLESFTLPVEDKLLLSRLMHRLTGIQKDVIEMLFYKEMTQEEVARQLGLSQRQISRIKNRSLMRMKSEKTR